MILRNTYQSRSIHGNLSDFEETQNLLQLLLLEIKIVSLTLFSSIV